VLVVVAQQLRYHDGQAHQFGIGHQPGPARAAPGAAVPRGRDDPVVEFEGQSGQQNVQVGVQHGFLAESAFG
jgi:hypothetical protein